MTTQNKTLYRSATFERAAASDSRTVSLAFSSEEPYNRWFGVEVLDHAPESILLDRLLASGPLLVGHNTSDQVGVVERVTIGADRVARADVRFGRSARAEEIYQDVLDGIRKTVSVGYVVHEMVLEQKVGDVEHHRVKLWEPLEISLVPIPADPTVGVGRNLNLNEEVKMQDVAKPEIDVQAIESRGYKIERERAQAITALGDKFKQVDLARQFIESGRPVDEFRAAILEKQGASEAMRAVPNADVGLTDSEARQFSFVRAINALANPTDRNAQRAAAFEYECSLAAADKQGKQSQGIMIPVDVLRRDLLVGTSTAGGHTVATDLMSASFIDLLRNSTVVMQRARTLTNLVGNIAIPRQTGGATAYWVAENGAPTESQQAFDQVTMSPKTIGAFTDVSRKLLLQSSIDVEGFVKADIAKVLGIGLDLACINGSGASNQPLGILNTSGIGSVAGGTNGLAPTFAHMISLETEVAQDNADVGSLFYISNTKVRGKLKGTEKSSSTGLYVFDKGMINDYPALTTNQVPSNLTKGTSSGVCSAVIFGNLSDLIVGMWGGLDLTVDPYAGATAGTVRVVALQDADVAVRHPESFAAMLDALTA